jgi:putative ABC transport system permease protein
MSFISDLSERWRALSHRDRADRELDEELSFHLDQDVATRVARGVDPDAARRDALIALGGLVQVTEEVRQARGVQPLEDLAGDIRYAARLLGANRIFAVTVIGVLGGAIGAAIAVFAVADATLLSDSRYGISNRLVRIYQMNSPENRWSLSSVDALAILEQQRSFDAVGMARRAEVALAGAGTTERAVAGFGTAGFFTAAGARAAEGRLPNAADESPSATPVVVVSHAFAAERFGTVSALGRDLAIDGVHHAIVGVLPEAMVELAGIRSRLWLPLTIKTPTRRGPFWLRGVGLLRPGVSFDQAAQDLAGISRRVFPLWASSFRDKTAVMTPVPIRETILGDSPKRVGLFSGAVLLVWLIALANVATLMLVRASARGQELAIRMALGAGRGRVARLLVTDSLMLTGAAGLVAIAIAGAGIRLARVVAPDLPHIADASLNTNAVLFAVAAAIVSGLLVSVPALFAGLGRCASTALGVDGRRIGRDQRTSRLRGVLVAAEFTLALPLVASAFWFLQTIWRLEAVDPGFPAAGAVALNVELRGPRYADGPARAAFWQRLENRARDLPGITATGLAGNIPPDDPSDVNNFDLIDRPAQGGAEPTAPWNVIRSGFLDALGVRLLEGRDFTAAEYDSGSPAALVSASWARRYFPGQSALGRKMVEGGCTSCPLTEVVGVVSDVPYQGLDGNGDSVYQASDPSFANSYFLVARTTTTEDAAIRALTDVVHSIDSSVLVEASTFRGRLGDALTEPRHWAALVGGFAAAAGTLAALGLFGLMSYVVRQQRRDIGVRLALGATPAAMTRMVVARGVRYAVAGSIAGVVLAVLAGRWLAASSFGIQHASSVVVLTIAVILTAVAAVASWWPGYQASRIPTLEAMSVE